MNYEHSVLDALNVSSGPVRSSLFISSWGCCRSGTCTQPISARRELSSALVPQSYRSLESFRMKHLENRKEGFMDLWLCSITTQPSLDVGGHWTLLCLGPTASSCTFSDRMTGKILSSQWGPVMFRRTEPVSSCACTSQRHDKGQDKALWSSFQIRNGVYIRMYTYICTHIYIYTNVYIIESYRIHLIFTFIWSHSQDLEELCRL